MEDCALNGGFLLDLLRFRREEDSDFARLAAEGLIRCAEVHGTPGLWSRAAFPRATDAAATATPHATNSRWRLTGCGVFSQAAG